MLPTAARDAWTAARADAVSVGAREVCVLAGDLVDEVGVCEGVDDEASVCACDILVTSVSHALPEEDAMDIPRLVLRWTCANLHRDILRSGPLLICRV